jgi:glycogen(starch) synthase
MRIAYISYELPPDIPKGGIGTYTLQAAALMQAAGHEVSIFCGSPSRSVYEQAAGVDIYRVLCTSPDDFTEKVLPIFREAHTSKAFDLIECPEIHGNGRLIKQSFPQLSLIVRLHGPDFLVESLKKTYTSFAVKARYRLGAIRRGVFTKKLNSYNKASDNDLAFASTADQISAPSDSIKQWAMKQWGISDEKITVLPNPFTAPEMLSANEVHTGIAKEILFFGRLNVLKGTVNFTKAMKIILQKFSEMRVTIIGDDAPGPYREPSMKHWMQKELQNYAGRISFYEGMDQESLYKHIGAADIVVLPSLFETFSYTCAEAMAAGKAIIGSSAGGMKELLSDGAGIAVDPYDADAIAAATEKLITDDGLRIKMSEKAQQKMQSDLYTKKVSSQMTALYTSVIQKPIPA